MFRKSARLTLIVVVVSLSFSACTKVGKPASDSTPPKITWKVKHLPSNTQEILDGSGSPQVNQALDETLTITLDVDDPEGVHEITLGCSNPTNCGIFNCGEKGGPPLSGLSLALPTEKKTDPSSGSYVEPRLYLTLNIKPKELMICKPPDYEVKSADFTLIGNGENYFQGKTQSKLRICIVKCQ